MAKYDEGNVEACCGVRCEGYHWSSLSLDDSKGTQSFWDRVGIDYTIQRLE